METNIVPHKEQNNKFLNVSNNYDVGILHNSDGTNSVGRNCHIEGSNNPCNNKGSINNSFIDTDCDDHFSIL